MTKLQFLLKKIKNKNYRRIPPFSNKPLQNEINKLLTNYKSYMNKQHHRTAKFQVQPTIKKNLYAPSS